MVKILGTNRSEAEKDIVLLECNIKMDTERNEYLENRQEMLQENWFCGLSTQYETKKKKSKYIYIYSENFFTE